MQVTGWSHRSARIVRVLALLLLLGSALSGCTKLLYDRLDTLAGWYLNSLVSLDDAQRKDLQSWLEQTLEWHRRSELTRYAQFLRQLSAAAAAPGTVDTYAGVIQQAQTFAVELAGRAAPQAARLLMSLSAAQVAQLAANLEDKSRERSADNLARIAAGSWHARRAKDTERLIKRWTGSVTAAQKALVSDATRQLQPTSADWLESQQRWRTVLSDTLNARGSQSPAAVEQRVLQLLREPNQQWTEQYRAKSNANRARMLELFQALDASLTRSQRERLQRELIELAERLESLTGE